jgi:hypothetical protein
MRATGTRASTSPGDFMTDTNNNDRRIGGRSHQVVNLAAFEN